MIDNFSTLDATKITTFSDANTAFKADIKNLITTYPKEVTKVKKEKRENNDDIYYSPTEKQTSDKEGIT